MSLAPLTKLSQVKLYFFWAPRQTHTGGEIKGQTSRALKKSCGKKTKPQLGVLLYSCHVKGHAVHSQPPSKGLLRVNNSESTARYTSQVVLLYLTLSVCFVPAMSQIISETRRKKCTAPLWRIGFFSLSPNRICKQGCRVWWGLVEVSPEPSGKMEENGNMEGA